MSATLLLAVDGGGTTTQALVADLEGRVLGRGVGPGSNHHRVGPDRFHQALTTAIEAALREATGVPPDGNGNGWSKAPFAAACFGLAGVDRLEDEELVARWARQQGLNAPFRVVNDSELILAAGTPEGWGVALVSGTGSVCLGRHQDGRSARVGGWGYLLGDEGSGYQVALRALRLATQTADGRAEAPELLQAVLRHWSLPNPAALIAHVHAPAMTQADIAGLAAQVLELAAQGDAAAGAIVDEAARDLARHVDAAVLQLGLSRPPLALAGGLMRPALRQSVQAALRCEVGEVSHVADPPLGAVVLARRLSSPPSGRAEADPPSLRL
jgi:N-acetylglucosamine kinase-like BadF-type ATPase